jgi:hypothetical protein
MRFGILVRKVWMLIHTVEGCIEEDVAVGGVGGYEVKGGVAGSNYGDLRIVR